MLFSSPIFLFIFLPVVFLFHGAVKGDTGKKIILVLASLFFYGWWEPKYLAIMIISILVNYMVYKLITNQIYNSKLITSIGVVFNVLLLGYFKYSYFLVDNLSYFIDDISIEKIILPLGISFFTFQQIAFLIDAYKKITRDYHLLDYALFVTFFPQLIAGPIVHHKEMMPQFEKYKRADVTRIIKGLVLFSIGMFKKLFIADTFSLWVDAGYSNYETLSFLSSWLVSISYTVQLYYDFSGYCDMAIGLALIFNIKLPINFNSPYKAVSIQDFWRRWHITLSTWLKDYIYIPLGGNRKGTNSAMLNVFITFLIGGIWHGAGWNFIMWGAFHGMALAAHRLWSRSGLSMPRPIGWLLTILFVNFAWVFFRAEDMNTAITVVNEMVSFNLNTSGLSLLIGASISIPLLSSMYSSVAMAIFLCMVLIGTLAMRNSLEITKYAEDSYNLPFKVVVFYGSLLGLTSLSMFLTSSSKFLYFNF